MDAPAPVCKGRSVDILRLTDDAFAPRADAIARLRHEAFGMPVEEARRSVPAPAGVARYAADDGGRPLALANLLDHRAWFGGRPVPQAGIGGVTVAAEARGRGLLRPLLSQLLRDARERGAAVSGLFPTAPGIYRGLGYELVTARLTVPVETGELAAIRPVDGLELRRLSGVDLPVLNELQDRWAREQNCVLERSHGAGGLDVELDHGAQCSGAYADGELIGQLTWRRGGGPGPRDGSALSALELVALDRGAATSLLALLGSFSSVAQRVELRIGERDPWRLLLRSVATRVVDREDYMLRVLDVPAAWTGRGVAAGIDATVEFRCIGDPLGMTDGSYRLSAAGGVLDCAVVAAADPDLPTFTPGGLACWYARRAFVCDAAPPRSAVRGRPRTGPGAGRADR